MVTIGARTDMQALTAHAHGIKASDFCPSSFMPMGKGIPMKKPSGISEAASMAILAFIGKGNRALISSGYVTLYMNIKETSMSSE